MVINGKLSRQLLYHYHHLHDSVIINCLLLCLSIAVLLVFKTTQLKNCIAYYFMLCWE